MNVFVGIVVLMLCHVGAVLLLILLAWISSVIPVAVAASLTGIAAFGIFGIGITQLLYAIPLCLWLNRKGRADTAKGVIIGAVLTLLLNGGCFILMLGVLSGV